MSISKKLILRPEFAADFDTIITNANTDRNYGSFASIYVGRSAATYIYRGLIKFDLSELPAGATITSAIVRLYEYQSDNTTAYDVSLYRSLVEWYEGYANGAVPYTSIPSSVWSHRIYNTDAWAGGAGGVSGTEWEAVATDTESVLKTGVFYEWDVTADVQAFHAGTYNNYGWWIINANEGTDSTLRRFYSANHTEVGFRPRLVVEYTESNTDDWYDTDWLYRKKITIDCGFVDADLNHFPLLVDASGDGGITSKIRNNGVDVLFTADDGVTRLPHELVGPPYQIVDLDGTWVFFGGPIAVRYSNVYDKTYVGWVNKAGDVEVAAYNHGTGSWEGPTTLKAALDADDHASPAILIRADGYVMVFYCAHHGADMYMRISSNPEDISAFAAEVGLGASVGSGSYNYPVPFQLTGEVDDPIYLYFTNGPGNRYLRYTKSSDGGTTWAAYVEVFNTMDTSYYHLAQNGGTRIDIGVSDVHPGGGTAGLYHFYYDNGNWYKSDGTQIVAALPHDETDCTAVHTGDATDPWILGVAINSSGNPVMVYVTYPDGHLYRHVYRYAAWDGASWNTAAITGKQRPLCAASPHYPGGASIDPNNVNYVYLSVPRNGVLNIVKYVTADNGATWTESDQLTSSFSVSHIRPFAVLNGSSELPVVWLHGIYTDYDVDIAMSVVCGLNSTPAKFWVCVPQILNGSDTDIYIYYGNSNAAPQALDELAWEKVYDLVWHGWRRHIDVAQASHPPIQAAINLPIANTAGSVYECLSGLYNHAVDFGIFPNMQALAGVTTEILVNHDSTGLSTDSPVANWHATGAGVLQRITVASNAIAMYARTAAGQIGGAFSNIIAANTVKRMALRYSNAAGLEGFVDKTLDATTYGAGSGTLANVASQTLFFASEPPGGANDLKGSLEEGRIAPSCLSTAWLDLVFDNIFYTVILFNAEENAPAPPVPVVGRIPRHGCTLFSGLAIV